MSAGDIARARTPRRLIAFLPVAAFLALAALFLLRLGAGDASKIPSALIGKSVPSFSLPPLTGLADVPGLSDADLRGNGVTVVNVFASWCVPCHEEHPVLAELARDGVRLVGIAYKDDPENTRRFLGQAGNPYARVGADRSGRTGIDFGVTGVPESFVVRNDGTIAFKQFGPITEETLRNDVLPAIRKGRLVTARVSEHEKLTRAFAIQAQACTTMGAPFNGRVCRALSDILDATSALGRRVLEWPADNLGGDLVPLRCCAGFHALARAERVPELAAVYPPKTCDDATLRTALLAAIAQEDAFLAKNLDSAPQTNEIGRSAILLGGLLFIASRYGLPVALYEVGASAGLNMQFDRFGYDLGEGRRWGDANAPVELSCPWTGDAPSLTSLLEIASRAACDLNPLDPRDPAARERLLSYIWPDQADRLERTAAAFAIAAASDVVVEKADARAWIARMLAPDAATPGTVTVLFHSVFIQYLPPPLRAALIADILARGESATDDAPFAWLRMEAGETNRAQCELRLTTWPGGEARHLADVDWHGRNARWA